MDLVVNSVNPVDSCDCSLQGKSRNCTGELFLFTNPQKRLAARPATHDSIVFEIRGRDSQLVRQTHISVFLMGGVELY